MKFIKKIKNVFVPLKDKHLDSVAINPGDIILAFNDDGTPYGVCGAAYATQVELCRQIGCNTGRFLSQEPNISSIAKEA
jgi:hypothetical protein